MPSRLTIAAYMTFSEQHAADSSSERMPPSFCSARYADAASFVVGTTSRARWKIACPSSSPRDALSCRLSRASVARWYADNTATMTTTREVTPATWRDLIDIRRQESGLLPPASFFLFHPIQLVVQRLQADAEDLGRPGLVVARVLERQHDQAALRFVDGRPGRERDGRQRFLPLRHQQRRQMRGRDEVGVREDRRTLHDVSQLADVARPRILLEDLHRILIDRAHRLAVDGIELVEEPLDQQRHVFAALAQRRQLDCEDVQAVIEVFPQLAVADSIRRIHVRRRDDADIDRLLLAAAEPPERPLLQHPQQLHLRRGLHLRNLVEKQRAAVRELEDAGAPIVRAGERALLVPEDLALEQRLRNRGAIDRDERKRRSLAQLVNRLRDELLAGSRFAPDQHRCVGRRRLFDDAIDASNAGAVADDPPEAPLLAKLAAEVLHLAQRLLTFDRFLQQDLQPLRVDWLTQVIVRTFLDRLDGTLDGALRGQQNEREIG